MSKQYQNYLENFNKIKGQYSSPDAYLQDYISQNSNNKQEVDTLLKKYKDPTIAASKIIYKNSAPSLWQTAKSGFYEGYLGTLKNLDEFSKMLGMESPEYYSNRVQQIQQEQERNYVPQIGLGDIHNIGTGLKYAAQLGGGLGEFGAEMAAGGLGGRVLEGASRLAPSVLRALGIAKKASKAEEVSKAIEEALNFTEQQRKARAIQDIIGRNIQTQAVVAPSQIGEVYGNQPENKKSPLAATASGLAASTLYTASPERALGVLKGATKAEKGVSNELIKTLTGSNIAKAFPKATSAAIEGLKESLLQSATLTGAEAVKELGSGQGIDTKKLEEPAILGALFGGVTGGLGGIAKAKEEIRKEKVSNELKVEEQKHSDELNGYIKNVDAIQNQTNNLIGIIKKNPKSPIAVKYKEILNKNLEELSNINPDNFKDKPKEAHILSKKIDSAISTLGKAEEFGNKIIDKKETVSKLTDVLGQLKNIKSKREEELAKLRKSQENAEPLFQKDLAQANEKKKKLEALSILQTKVGKRLNKVKDIYQSTPVGDEKAISKIEGLKVKTSKGETTPYKYSEEDHKAAILDKFNSKEPIIKNTKGKEDYKKTVEIYKSTGLTENKILSKIGDKIPKDKYTPEMAKTYIFGNDNAKFSETPETIPNMFKRIVEIGSSKNKTNRDLALKIHKEFQAKFNKLLDERKKEYSDQIDRMLPSELTEKTIRPIIDKLSRVTAKDSPERIFNKIAVLQGLKDKMGEAQAKEKEYISNQIHNLNMLYFKEGIKALPKNKNLKRIGYTEPKNDTVIPIETEFKRNAKKLPASNRKALPQNKLKALPRNPKPKKLPSLNDIVHTDLRVLKIAKDEKNGVVAGSRGKKYTTWKTFVDRVIDDKAGDISINEKTNELTFKGNSKNAKPKSFEVSPEIIKYVKDKNKTNKEIRVSSPDGTEHYLILPTKEEVDAHNEKITAEYEKRKEKLIKQQDAFEKKYPDYFIKETKTPPDALQAEWESFNNKIKDNEKWLNDNTAYTSKWWENRKKHLKEKYIGNESNKKSNEYTITSKDLEKVADDLYNKSENIQPFFDDEGVPFKEQFGFVSHEGDAVFPFKNEKSKNTFSKKKPSGKDLIDYAKKQGIKITKYIKENLLDKIEDIYKFRKKQAFEKDKITGEDVKKWATALDTLIDQTAPYQHKNIIKLSADVKKIFDSYHKAVDTISKEAEKSFDFKPEKIIKNIFGEELAKKIKVKLISHLSLEDLGGRDKVIQVFKDDYNIDLNHLSDKELLDKVQHINGSVIFNTKEKSALVMLAHHTDDTVGKTLYHELFHIIDKYGMLSDKELAILKKHTETFKDDPRSWDEKIADDFALYSVNSKLYKKGLLNNIYQRVKKFLFKLKLKFKGAKTPEDIYYKILSGEAKPNADYMAYMHYNTNLLSQPKFSMPSSGSIVDNFGNIVETLSHREDLKLKNRAIQTTMEALSAVKNFFTDFTKGIAPELNIPERIKAREVVRRLASLKSIAHEKTIRQMSEILKGLEEPDKKLMEQYLIIKDIHHSLSEKIQTFDNIQMQWKGLFKTEDDVVNTLNKLQKKVDSTPAVKEALKRRTKILSDLIDYLKEKGYISSTQFLDVESYFHRITERTFHDRIKLHTTYEGNTPMVNPLLERVNSAEPYVTEYIYSEYEALAQFNLLKDYADNILPNLKTAENYTWEELKKDLKSKNIIKVKDLKDALAIAYRYDDLREKYKDFEVHTIDDIPHIFTVYQIPNDLAKKILEEGISSVDLSRIEKEMRPGVGIQKYNDQFLAHKDTIKAMERVVRLAQPSSIEKFLRFNISTFKKWVLFSPFRILKYFTNNAVSDAEFAFTLSPKIVFKHSPKAAKDLYNYYIRDKKDLSTDVIKEIQEAEDSLVLGSNLTSEEVLKIATIDKFRDVMGTKPGIYQQYFELAGKWNNYRESILRLAAYRHYKEMLKNEKLENITSVVDNDIAKEFIKEGKIDELAAKMAREGIGDYGNISPSGQYLRTNLIPFWSWTEVNMGRYYNLFKVTTKMLKQGKIPVTQAAALTVRAYALYGMVTAWNSLMFPQVSDQINDANSGRISLILGVDNNGEAKTLSINSSLTDLLDWGGLSNFPEVIHQATTGMKPIPDIFKDVAKAPVNKLVNMASPILKTSIELMSGLSLYPSVFSPRVIRDKYKHALNLYGMGLPYEVLLSNNPVKPDEKGALSMLGNVAFRSLFYDTDVQEANYYTVKDIARTWAKDNGIERPVTIPTEKSNYAFYFRKAIKVGDKDAAIHYLAQYYLHNGTLKSMNKSLKMLHPLVNVPKSKRAEFFRELSLNEQLKVKQAIKWYENIYFRKSKFTRTQLLDIYNKAYKLSIEQKRKVK